jgi:hypothetical protein
MSVIYNNMEFDDKEDAILFFSQEINLKRPLELAIDAAYSAILDQMRELGVPKELAEEVFEDCTSDLTIDCN